MSWYEEAAKEIVENIAPNASTGHESDCSCDDCRMLKVGRIENARQIIAKHDPNRWVPVEEKLPPLDNFNRLTSKRRLVIQKGRTRPVLAYWNPRCGHWQGHPYSTDIVRDVTHWREIVLPEVEG